MIERFSVEEMHISIPPFLTSCLGAVMDQLCSRGLLGESSSVEPCAWLSCLGSSLQEVLRQISYVKLQLGLGWSLVS